MVRLTYRPNMVLAVYRGRKAKKTYNTQQSNANFVHLIGQDQIDNGLNSSHMDFIDV